MTAAVTIHDMTPTELTSLLVASGRGAEVAPSFERPNDPFAPPDIEVSRSRAAVLRAGRTLWAAEQDFQFEQALVSLANQIPWPSALPLLTSLWLGLPEDQRTAQVMEKLEKRAHLVFGPRLTKFFMRGLEVSSDLYRVEHKLWLRNQASGKKIEDILPPGENLMDLLSQDDFPPTLRDSIVANFHASMCELAIIDVMLKKERRQEAKSERILETWQFGRALNLLVSAGLLDDPQESLMFTSAGVHLKTAEELVEEGKQQKARIERLLSEEEDDLDEVKSSIRTSLARSSVQDVDEVLARASQVVFEAPPALASDERRARAVRWILGGK